MIGYISQGRDLVSIWDSYKHTTVRLAHYINGEPDPCMQKCSQLDKNSLFSITKKAEKFLSSTTIKVPPNLENKPLLRQAQIISQRFKEATYELRYKRFIEKPQHGVFFRQMKENKLNMKASLSWLD